MKMQGPARVLAQGLHLGPLRSHHHALTHGLLQPLTLGVISLLSQRIHGATSQTRVQLLNLLNQAHGVANLSQRTHGVISQTHAPPRNLQTHVPPRSLLLNRHHGQLHLPSPGELSQLSQRAHGVLNQLHRPQRPAETSLTMPPAHGVTDQMKPAAQTTAITALEARALHPRISTVNCRC